MLETIKRLFPSVAAPIFSFVFVNQIVFVFFIIIKLCVIIF